MWCLSSRCLGCLEVSVMSAASRMSVVSQVSAVYLRCLFMSRSYFCLSVPWFVTGPLQAG